MKGRDYPRLAVTKKGERAIADGSLWVFDGEVVSCEPHENGCLADVIGEKGNYLGTGFVSDKSRIRARIVSQNANDRFDADFWLRRARWAWKYRKTVMGGDASCCRVVFGDADGFPGMTADLFGDVLVTQTLSLGMDMAKEIVFPQLARALNEDGIALRGIYERNDSAQRELEGMEQGRGWFPGLPNSGPGQTEICENGLYFFVDFENGQKTGFFLDQKYNRRAVAALARGMRVLDCFTNAGPFALCAAAAGAEFVLAVDSSEAALELARRNAGRNGLSQKVEFLRADVFDLLPELETSARGRYDIAVLDPPAFAKSRGAIAGAERGYREINRRAMRLLPRGGYLATCSCSRFMTDGLFRDMLVRAAADASVRLKQIESRRQSPDHPVLWGMPETEYLKFYIFQTT